MSAVLFIAGILMILWSLRSHDFDDGDWKMTVGLLLALFGVVASGHVPMYRNVMWWLIWSS